MTFGGVMVGWGEAPWYRFTEASWSFRQSTMVPRWRCTALWSVDTIFCSDVMEMYLRWIEIRTTHQKRRLIYNVILLIHF